MRPPGQLRRRLRQVASTLTTDERAPTARELAGALQADPEDVCRTIDRMRRAGELVPVRPRSVGYRRGPVMEYAPRECVQAQGLGRWGLAAALAGWTVGAAV